MTKDICKAAKKGDIKTIRKYVPNEVRGNEVDKDGKSALHWAIEGDHYDCVVHLLDNGASINYKDPKSVETPIIASLKRVAVSEKQEDIAIYLMSRGADLNCESRDRRTPERILESLPKRFQVKYKEAYQKKYQAKSSSSIPQYKPAATSSPNLTTLTTQVNSISISNSTGGASTSSPPGSPPGGVGSVTTTSSPNLSKLGGSPPPSTSSTAMRSPPIGVISTVAPAPITTASGKTYTRPVQLDITATTLLPEDYSRVKDISLLWLEITYKLSIVAICSDKIRYDDIAKAVDECGNVLAHFLPIIGDAENTSFMESVINQEAVATISERVKNVRDGLKLRLFNRIEQTEVIRLVAALVGSLQWLYNCWFEVTDDAINTSIAECALSCRLAMNAITYRTSIPPGVLTNIAKLCRHVSARVFVCRSPALAKRLSDSCLLVARTFKSLMVLSILGDRDTQKSPENLIALGKIIAEQLSSIKTTISTMVPSRVTPLLEQEAEHELVESAAKQLRGSIDFYRSNNQQSSHVGLPKEGVLLPLFASIQKSIQSLSLYSSEQHDLQMVIPAQMIAQDVMEIRAVISAFQADLSQNTLSEELNDQLAVALDTSFHFSSQLLFSVTAVTCHNRSLDMSQVGYAARGLSTCCCILLDSFCF
ncbi:hypothetical protein SAMD00019534_064420 [Acytostelium subglobosum LB1]|uniref:hypothetical protein n=1 Tax=Acytostelium subglobosum LB1 TaxID=1410327 RepID=UPI000644C83F|nr:hypothetical protein SAMD00019534_064420 [Acytostelium subglobosum LB1]GAM23267.1 hypothetical protein SAMD00019534_064420 [Acytostelium subglobosum LB1]|eukprot:XP_012753716.1 hypothetical protein SAMD00019534_064420 [Acytostelium subglobosum LB1]